MGGTLIPGKNDIFICSQYNEKPSFTTYFNILNCACVYLVFKGIEKPLDYLMFHLPLTKWNKSESNCVTQAINICTPILS